MAAGVLKNIKFANTVRNLGVCLDPTLSFQQQISSVCRICYLELHRISAIRHYLSEDVTKKLLCAFVLSRLDYCNPLLSGCPKYLLSKLPKVQNNADFPQLNLFKINAVTKNHHTIKYHLHIPGAPQGVAQVLVFEWSICLLWQKSRLNWLWNAFI